MQKVAVVYSLIADYPLALLLEISGISKALYYYHLKQSPYLDKNASIVEEIENCFKNSKKHMVIVE